MQNRRFKSNNYLHGGGKRGFSYVYIHFVPLMLVRKWPPRHNAKLHTERERANGLWSSLFLLPVHWSIHLKKRKKKLGKDVFCIQSANEPLSHTHTQAKNKKGSWCFLPFHKWKTNWRSFFLQWTFFFFFWGETEILSSLFIFYCWRNPPLSVSIFECNEIYLYKQNF